MYFMKCQWGCRGRGGASRRCALTSGAPTTRRAGGATSERPADPGIGARVSER